MIQVSAQNKFAICVSSEGCDDIQVWKLYRLLPDVQAAADNYLRVVDDSGEDYLYPGKRFVVVEFPEIVAQQILAAVGGGTNDQ